MRPHWYGESLSLVSTTHLVQVCGGLPLRVDHGITKVAVVYAKVTTTFGEEADKLLKGARVVVITFAQGIAAVGHKDRVVVGVPGHHLHVTPACLSRALSPHACSKVAVKFGIACPTPTVLGALTSIIATPCTLPTDYGGWPAPVL